MQSSFVDLRYDGIVFLWTAKTLGTSLLGRPLLLFWSIANKLREFSANAENKMGWSVPLHSIPRYQKRQWDVCVRVGGMCAKERIYVSCRLSFNVNCMLALLGQPNLFQKRGILGCYQRCRLQNKPTYRQVSLPNCCWIPHHFFESRYSVCSLSHQGHFRGSRFLWSTWVQTGVDQAGEARNVFWETLSVCCECKLVKMQHQWKWER